MAASVAASSTSGESHRSQQQSPSVPPIITNFTNSFPFSPPALQPHNPGAIDLNYLVKNHLPPWSEAWRLSQLYLQQAPWFFCAVTKRQLHEELLPMWFPEAASFISTSSGAYSSFSTQHPLASSSTTSQNGQEQSTKGKAHDLALLFVIFCFGVLTDPLPASSTGSSSISPNSTSTSAVKDFGKGGDKGGAGGGKSSQLVEADKYYQLSKAALCLRPILDCQPSLATVQTLAMMSIYQSMAGGENSMESMWAIMGIANKLAQTVSHPKDVPLTK